MMKTVKETLVAMVAIVLFLGVTSLLLLISPLLLVVYALLWTREQLERKV